MPVGSVAQGKVNAEIIMKLDALDRGIADANTKLRKFSTGVTTQSKVNAKVMSAAWIAGFALISVAAIKLSKKITSAFKNMVGVYAGFEQSLANTQSVARATAEELDRMEAAARRVGATTRSTASQAANALYYLASAGFSAGEAIAALDGVNALAIATQSDLAKTSETVAVTIRQYGLETSAATDIANTFTAAITSSLATMNKLAKSFEYVGPIAAGLGLTVEKTTGALQLLYNKGFSGEKAGRGLRSILVDLADATSVINRKLGNMGIAFDKVNPAANDLADIMDTLRENGVNAANAAAIFGKVSGVQLASLISIASDAKGGMNELTEAVTGTNRAFEAMAIQMDTLKGSFDKFKNAEEALKISIGKGLDPALTSLVDVGTDIIKFINELHPMLLALGTILITIAAVATMAAVAMTAFSIAAASVVLAPVIAAVGALILPLTLLGAGTVGVIAGMSELKKIKLAGLTKEFRNVAKEIGIAKDEIKAFIEQIEGIESSVTGLFTAGGSFGELGGSKDLIKDLDEIAKAYNITTLQLIRFIDKNKELKDLGGEAFLRIKQVAEAQSVYFNRSTDLVDIQIEHLKTLLKLRQEATDMFGDDNEKSALAEKLQEKLRIAFRRARDLQILLGDEFDRNTYLTNIFNDSLEDMVNSGMLATDEAIIRQGLLWRELQKIFGEVSSDEISDVDKNIAARDRLASRLRENIQLEKLAIENRTEYNKELEDSQAVIDAITGLIGENFKYEGEAIQQMLKDWGYLIILGEERIKLTEEYRQKLEELGKTEFDRIRDARAMALEGIAIRTDEYEAIVRYFNKLEEIHALETDTKRNVVLTDYAKKLKDLNNDQVEAIRDERDAAEEHLVNLYANGEITKEVFKKNIKELRKYYAVLEDRAVWDHAAEYLQTYGNLAVDLYGALLAIQRATADEEIRILEEVAQARIDASDDVRKAAITNAEEIRDAELLAAGIVADDRRQRLEDAIEQAKLGGDLITIIRAEQALERFDILEKYNDSVATAEEDAATRKEDIEEALAAKIAKINYDQAVKEWQLGKLSIVLNGAIAAMKAMTYGPKGWVIAAGMGVLTGLQLIAANKAKPVLTQFKDGGIVPGSSYKGDSTEVLANAGELILNKTQQENVIDQMTNNDQPIYITINTILDGKVVATNSAKYYRNGQVVI